MVFDRLHPFQATIVSRHLLNKEVGLRETWHFELSIGGSGIAYQPGDSFAMYPENDPGQVERILLATHLDPHALVQDARGVSYTIETFLRAKANIAHVPKKFLVALAARGSLEAITSILADDDAVKYFTQQNNLVEIVETYSSIVWDPQSFVSALQPMLPRFYSISSAQSVVGDEVHFTVARVHYTVDGKERRGICSHFLCDLAPMNKPCVSLYLQPSKDFHLPQDNSRSIIMIGPGTGVAPFRGFMQERVFRKASGKNWLFFGERHQGADFFYEDFWKDLVRQGLLRLDVAFSRDQPQKVYVQHVMWEQRKSLWQWIQEGAIIYVCGSADTMAKDVDICLHHIAESEGMLSADAAKEYVKMLRKEKRYIRDIY